MASETKQNSAAVGSSSGQGSLGPDGVPTDVPGGVVKLGNVVKFSGAFIAFMIGSGYASGQEIMQFFTAYGIWSIGGLLIAMILFAWLGKVLMNYGYRHRDLGPDEMADTSFRYYCGKYFGAFLAWFIPVFLLLVCIVMTSGAGATLAQYFGLPTWVGSLGMCVLVFITNLFGFKRIVDIVGALGPLTIIFSIVIAIFAIASNPEGLANIGQKADVLATVANATNGAPLWALAGLLYVAYNMAGSVPFLTQTGGIASSAREAKWGALLGGVMFIAAGLLMNLALLCYIDDVAALEVPTLFLSDLISPVVSVIFAIILLDEIYSTAAPMMWTAVNRFVPDGTIRNRIAHAVAAVIVLAVVLSPLSYSQLLGIIYPYTGYIGIVFIACVIVRQCIELRNKRKGLPVETPLFQKKQ